MVAISKEELLEKVQKRAIRLMIKDRSLSYEERLQKFGLMSLETRRLRRDLIEVFKIFKGFDNINTIFHCQIPDLEVTHEKFINHTFVWILENIYFQYGL